MKKDTLKKSDVGSNLRQIKSFVFRRGRMSSAQHRYMELLPRYSIPFSHELCDLSKYFLRRQRLILEIGFGMGDASIKMAIANPHINYLGIEVYSPGVARTLKGIEDHRLDNIRIIQHDVVDVIKYMIPVKTFYGVHIFFPDPWPKNRHAKRRLIQDAFLADLLPLILLGGYIYAVTDWKDYARWILERFEATRCLEQKLGNKPVRPQTTFETKGRKKGNSIHELFFVKSHSFETKTSHT